MFRSLSGIFLLLSLAVIQSYAQDQSSCAFTLKEAQKQYSQGLIEKIPGMISGCLQSGFTRQERQDAYKLLIMCYLSDNEMEKADSAMLSFLKKYPEYEPLPTDTREFTYLFESYRTLPVVSIGLTGGIISPQFFVTESNSLNDLNNTARSYKRSGVNFQAGLKVNTFLSEKYELELNILFSQLKFQTTDQFAFDGISTQQTLALETQNRLKIPIALVYTLVETKKISLFAKAGLVSSINLGTTLDPTRTYVNNAHNSVTGSPVNIDLMRNQFNLGGLVGAGLKFKIPHGYLFGDLQYQAGFTKQLKTSGLYSFPDLRDRFYFLSDNFRINQLGFNLGYCYSFYKPTKKK